MALETEIKLSLPASAAHRLPAHGLLADSKPLRQKLVNTYYDTPDRRQQRERVAVRFRQKGTEWREPPPTHGVVWQQHLRVDAP